MFFLEKNPQITAKKVKSLEKTLLYIKNASEKQLELIIKDLIVGKANTTKKESITQEEGITQGKNYINIKGVIGFNIRECVFKKDKEENFSVNVFQESIFPIKSIFSYTSLPEFVESERLLTENLINSVKNCKKIKALQDTFDVTQTNNNYEAQMQTIVSCVLGNSKMSLEALESNIAKLLNKQQPQQ